LRAGARARPGRRRLRVIAALPPRTATDAYLAEIGERLDVEFDVDLGELVEGHRVVARGVLNLLGGAELHYELVPAWDSDGAPAGWEVIARDDVGTDYGEVRGGSIDPPDGGGAATHGIRDIGGPIPAEAHVLGLEFTPHRPLTDYTRRLFVDLATGAVTEERA
jgi:hypothetical protein